MNRTISHLKKNLLAYIIIVCGLLGTYAAFTLLLNRIEYFKNLDFVPPCSINVWLDCGIVMKSKWASLFGFPNAIIGLITYPLATLTGLMILLNKNNNKYLMLGCTALAGLGFITNIILLYISSYLIGSLCPWCILAGVCTSNIFFSLINYDIQNNFLFKDYKDGYFKRKIQGGWDILIVILFYLLIALFVYFSFFLRENGIFTHEFFDPIFWKWSEK
jgi:uncharacterized membrane protein